MTAIYTLRPYHSRVPLRGFFAHDQEPLFFSSLRYPFRRTACTLFPGETKFLPRRNRVICSTCNTGEIVLIGEVTDSANQPRRGHFETRLRTHLYSPLTPFSSTTSHCGLEPAMSFSWDVNIPAGCVALSTGSVEHVSASDVPRLPPQHGSAILSGYLSPACVYSGFGLDGEKRRIRTADALRTLGFQYVCVPPIRVLGFGYLLTNRGCQAPSGKDSQ